MKTQLVKRVYRWDLYNEDDHKIASTLDGCLNKLSTKNCQAIENGYDLDELLKEQYPIDEPSFIGYALFKRGFKLALEILGDKKFSINEVVELCKILMSNPIEKYGKTYQELTDNYIQSLQQTEWDVEIEMEFVEEEQTGTHLVWGRAIPKLDADGCLILKKI